MRASIPVLKGRIWFVPLGILLALVGCFGLLACGAPSENVVPDQKPESWSEASHGKGATPNYALIFDTTKVHRLDITIQATDWKKMQENMTTLVGTFGQGGGPGGQPPGGQPPGGQGMPGQPSAADQQALQEACKGKEANAACSATIQGREIQGSCSQAPDNSGVLCMPTGGQQGPPGGQQGPGQGSLDLIPEDPIYVPCTLQYEGKEWRHVGIRYKGNSSLQSGWSSGSYKLPFRLQMDKYEEQYTSTKDQRFYGFKKLTFGNGFSDASYLREMIASELFREAGVPVARVALYRIFIDYGEGSKYFGLYSMVEDPDGPMMEEQFKKSGGNLYKPDGSGADWVSFVQEGFVKKTNEDKADWSDVKAAIEALHSTLRSTDAATWRANLEKLFHVDGFLRWLALSTLMGNWDSYGNMTHNYYLYADPSDAGRLKWITWDHNMVMMGSSGRSPGRELSLDLATVDGSRWPLIRYLIDDPTYKKSYQNYVSTFAKGPFTTEKVMARLKTLHSMITPYVTGAEGEVAKYTQLDSPESFTNALSAIQSHIETRQQAATSYLATQP